MYPHRFWIQPAERVGYVVSHRDAWPTWAFHDHTLIRWEGRDDHLRAIRHYRRYGEAAAAGGFPVEIERLVLLFLGIRQ
jgi:hypothetical protein